MSKPKQLKSITSFFILIMVTFFIMGSLNAEESWSYMVNSNKVNALCISGNDLWIGTQGGGVIQFDVTTHEMKGFTRADGLASHDISDIAVDGSDNVWCTTEYGIMKYDGSTWVCFNEENLLPPAKSDYSDYTLAIDNNGDLWIGGESGIYLFDGNSFIYKHDKNCKFIGFDLDGNLWITVWGEGAYKFAKEDWIQYTTDDGLMTNNLFMVFFDSLGNIWFYGRMDNLTSALTKFDGETMTSYGYDDGVPSMIYDIAGDSQGNLWFACNLNSLYMFDGENWTSYTKDFLYPEFDGDLFYCDSICVDLDDSIWVGLNKGLSNFTPIMSIANHYDLPQDYPIGGKIKELNIAPDGTVWLGVGTGGIVTYDGKEWTIHFGETSTDWEAQDFVFADNGDVWTAVRNGLRHYSNGKWELLETAGETQIKKVNSICLDLDENLWVATSENGIFKFDGINWTHFEFTGVEEEGPLSKGVIDCACDNDGNIWFTGMGGISKYNGETWKWYTTEDGLISPWPYSIMIDSHSNIWIGAAMGINRFDGKDEWVTYKDFGSMVTNLYRCIYEDSRGNIWFGGEDGAVKFDGEYWTTYTWKEGLQNNMIIAITEDIEGDIWFASSTPTVSCGIAILHTDSEPQPELPKVEIFTDRGRYRSGDTITISISGENKGEGKDVDIYLVMLDPAQNLYFGLLWDANPTPVLSNIYIPHGFGLLPTLILSYKIPNTLPPIADQGNYIFALGLADPGTLNFFSISTANFEVLP